MVISFSDDFTKNSENSENSVIFECDVCNRKYNERTGLWKHKKKCITPTVAEESILDASSNEMKVLSNFLGEEFDAKIAYQNDEIKNPFGTNYHIYGISELTLGAKYLVYQQEFTDKSKEIRSWKRRMAFDKNRLIPSVGVFAGVHTNFLGKDYKDDGISFKGAVLLQNDFSDRLVVLTNLIADKITSDDHNYSYIIKVKL